MNKRNSCILHVPKYNTKIYGGSALYYLGPKMFKEFEKCTTVQYTIKSLLHR